MNSRSRKFPWIAIVLLVVIVGGAALLLTARKPPPEGNLSRAAIGGPFTLVDETGRTVTSDSFRGQWRLLYFGYTFCPDICPTDTAAIAAGLKAFEARYPDRAARVQPLFITLDPERDTPQVLAEFTANFHPRLLGLTGSRAQIDQVLKTFRIYASRVEGATPGSYTYDHAAMVYLMDPDGRPVEFVAAPKPATVEAMLERFVE